MDDDQTSAVEDLRRLIEQLYRHDPERQADALRTLHQELDRLREREVLH